MEIPIETNLNNYFKLYLTMINPILKLKAREIDLLSHLLLVHYANQSDPEVDSKILSTEVKKAVRLAIKMPEASFNNHISSLRKKQMLTETSINPILTAGYPQGNSSSITFNFSIK